MTSVRGASGTAAVRPAARAANRTPSLRPLPALSGVLEFREHAFVLPEYHVPAIVPPDVLAPVAAHRGAQAGVSHQQREASHEFVAGRIVQTAVALDAVLDEHLAAGVGENRCADAQCFEREQREALVRRRAGDDGRGLERLNPLAI